MRKHLKISGRIAIFCIVLGMASIGCDKTAPVSVTSAVSAESQKGDTATANGKFGKFDCFKHGAPLATSGVFDFPVDSTYDLISIWLGQPFGWFNWLELVMSNGPQGGADACNLTSHIYARKFYVTAQVYDLRGRLLFEVVDNKWKVNRNAVRRFNYDANGFEAYDQEGHIAISINRNPPGHIGNLFIQAILPCTSTVLGYYCNTGGVTYMPYIEYGTPALNRRFDEIYDSVPIQPLFRYTGRDWQHSRL